MDLHFEQIGLYKSWHVTDSYVVIGEKSFVCTTIKKVEHNERKRKITIFIDDANHSVYEVKYAKENAANGLQAYRFFEEQIEIRSENLKKQQKEQQELIEKLQKTEIRMRCNVCGTFFCYKMSDLIDNMENARQAQSSAGLAMFSALLGTQLGTYANISGARYYMGKIKDYAHCPNCHSTSLTSIAVEENQDGEIVQPVPTMPVAQLSPADEIRRFKDLCDQGVITQEEFETKKKQLLGL